MFIRSHSRAVSLEVTRRTVVAGFVIACVLFAAVAVGVVVASYEQPRVVSIDSEFGEVRDETADVHTQVVVDSPNDRSLPVGIDLRYTVSLNDIEVADGVERGVRIGSGENTVETDAAFDNTQIPAWWVSHINNDEQTTISTRSRLGILGLPGPRLPTESEEITTDLLGSLADESESTVSLGERDVLVVGNQRAEWQTADAETTPLRFSTDLENVHDRPMALDGTDYEIRMNGVVVGAGETDDGVELAPGESATFDVEAAIDTPKMQEWWVTHLEEGQSTDLDIEVFAVVESDDGERQRLPLTVFERQAIFETDMLGSGETTVTLVDADGGSGFKEPRVQETKSEWGAVGDDETEIDSRITLVNDNDEAFAAFLTLDIEQRTVLAGTTIADGDERVSALPRGEGEIALTSTKRHSIVPEWWAAHLENDERSVSRTEATAEADVGVTTLPVDLDDRESTVETELLADLNDDSRQSVRNERGRELLVVHSTTAEWVDPTPEKGLIRVEAELENREFVPVTLGEVDYAVDINDVTLADDRAPEEHTLQPGERRVVEFTLVLDNSRMEAWWPTHIENGELSVVDRRATATVESGGESERVGLEFLSEELEVKTDLLAG